MVSQVRKKLGIALGSGGARGFAHLGVLQALHKMGIQPDIVAGTSVGAIVGAFYAADKMPEFESWAKSLRSKQAFKLMDFQLFTKGAFVKGDKIIDFFTQRLGTLNIEELAKPFLAIATNLVTGQEVWLKDGLLSEAIRASMAFPGMLPSLFYRNQWLVDGGLVNPVPVSACRAMGAEVVIAVDLNQYLVGKRFQKTGITEQPGIMDVSLSAIHIMQDRITRSRMSGDPPEVLLAPALRDMGLLDFNRTQEAIDEGVHCVEMAMPALIELKNNL